MKRLQMSSLELGNRYSKTELAKMWGYENHNAIRKGIVTEKDNDNIVLFVTKDKRENDTQYIDNLDGNILYMMGQTRHGNDKRIANNLVERKDNFHLFYRENNKSLFVYYGECVLLSATINRESPSEFEFLLTDQYEAYEDDEEIINYIANIGETVDTTNEKSSITEGAKKVSTHIRYERNPRNRKEAIKIHGSKCLICGFDYNKVYGKELADSYIEIHHIKQLSKGEQEVNPAKDLIPVCANCHRMLHRRKGDNISVEELKTAKNVSRLKWYLSAMKDIQ